MSRYIEVCCKIIIVFMITMITAAVVAAPFVILYSIFAG